MTSYINSSHFRANSAGRQGGSVHLATSKFQGVTEFHSCTFRQNRALEGVAFSTNGEGYVKMVSTEFFDNQATHCGGAMAQYALDTKFNGQTVFESCTLTANRAGTDGGGIFVLRSRVELSTCRLLDNAAARYGGAVLADGAGLRLLGSFFRENNGSAVCTSAVCYRQEAGAAVSAIESTRMYIDSSIFAANAHPSIFVLSSKLVMRRTNLSTSVVFNNSDVLIDSSGIMTQLVFMDAARMHFLVLGGSHVDELDAPLAWSPEDICRSYTPCDEATSQLEPFFFCCSTPL